MFSVRIKPMDDESLISFFTRFATENGTKMLSIWHDSSKNKKINPQKADAHLLELTPEVFINLEDLAESTEVSKDKLIAMTYYNVLVKFCHPSEISFSRILKGMIRDELHFCPLCIQEKAYIRLKWKIDGVTCCVKHQIYLSKSCSHCCNSIKLIDVEHNEICPYCYFELKDTPSTIEKLNVAELEKEKCVECIWGKLLSYSGKYRSPSEVAVILLYLLNKENPYFNRDVVQFNAVVLKIHLPYLLQIARNTFSKKRTIHIKTLLNVMASFNIDYEYFEKLEIPKSFQTSITTSLKNSLFETMRCTAPWCIYFQKPGSLVKTGTTTKRHSNGSLFRNYVACTACGCRFASIVDGSMVEKDGFIKGYHHLKVMMEENDFVTIEECPRPINYNKDWRGIIAYFSTRFVFGKVEKLDDSLILAFVQAVQKNANMNNIHKWKWWGSYRNYLLYRYHIDVMNAQVYSRRKVPMRHNIESYQEQMIDLCREMIKNDEDISMERISLFLKVSANTIRTWGFQHYIKDMKKEQRKKRLDERKNLLVNRVDQFFEQTKNRRILSKDIYKFIGVSQSHLNSIAPDLNEYIREQRYQNLEK
ncbi:TniQ family protein [Paenibacillus paridis]|uniref:TniQ family protein n=1 Tax=Paenibacillus paridis TaxID=2583376 RepID=UPI00111ECA16|nr:TniQ family protein [Paenibacillus paridis]